MPRFLRSRNIMSDIITNSIEEVSVVDVYDLASDIGKECEKIIDSYGAESVSTLIPKCIQALEMLEALATNNERETSVVQELNDRISQLESEKLEKAETRKRFEKELEAIEEQWRAESRELLSMVNRLQDENRRLAKDQNNSQPVTPSKVLLTPDTSPLVEDGHMIQKLKEQIDKQRDEFKLKERQLQEKSYNADQLNTQIERLKNAGRESRRRLKLSQGQIKVLCEERADFLAQLQDQHRELATMKKQLGIAEKENEDLGIGGDDEMPRFTTAELKEVLAERNELKSRINDLEEELMACKPLPPKIEKKPDNLPTLHDDDDEDEEPVVQGPLPREPDDAPWKKCSESGIRKFFRKLFSDNDTGTSFPRRSLSTLSKMALSAGPHTDIPI